MFPEPSSPVLCLNSDLNETLRQCDIFMIIQGQDKEAGCSLHFYYIISVFILEIITLHFPQYNSHFVIKMNAQNPFSQRHRLRTY